MSFFSLLFLLFLGLKLAGIIAWSWWWVTCPLWAGFAIIGAIFAVLGVIVTIREYIKQKGNKSG